jgi:hypothetical protein
MADATSSTVIAAAEPSVHQRQRGDGGSPVGVNSRTKPSAASAALVTVGYSRATIWEAGSAPGRTTSP